MFTGLIAEVGSVTSIERTSGAARITIAAPSLALRINAGDSVAVSGVCLTALNIRAESFEADLAAETIARTSLVRLSVDTPVNLELPTAAGSPLGGHIVQGHVDGVGLLVSMIAVSGGAKDQTDWLLKIALPSALICYVVEKGSITIEGISLTVAAIDAETVTIAVIPHTYAATNLHSLKPGDEVNVEVDVLAKYAEKRDHSAETDGTVITSEYLIANGY